MNIGEAAKACGVSAKMIRYYEEIGLIPQSSRSPSGYRKYGQSDVYTLAFIQRARELGFSTNEIQKLLALWADPDRSSSEVRALTLGHIASLDEKIVKLRAMREALKALARQCDGKRPECPIIEELDSRPVGGEKTRSGMRGRRVQ